MTADGSDRQLSGAKPASGPLEVPSNPLNKRSDHLVVVVPTHNRLESLTRSLDSIARGTRCDHQVVVVDGGSTDGTVEYLRQHPDVTPLFQGRLLGATRAFNAAFRRIDSRYTCWLSDDTEVVDGSLDLGVSILEEHPEIGIVGLKMKDTMGPWKDRPYKGGLSHYRIMGCQHGILRTDLFRSTGFGNEDYRTYGWPGDTSASVMCTGKSIVHIRRIAVLHHRAWAEQGDAEQKISRDMGGIDNQSVYRKKFAFLGPEFPLAVRLKARLLRALVRILFLGTGPDSRRLGLDREDWFVIRLGRFMRTLEPLHGLNKPYHLVQKLPRRLLESEGNPYRHLVD